MVLWLFPFSALQQFLFRLKFMELNGAYLIAEHKQKEEEKKFFLLQQQPVVSCLEYRQEVIFGQFI